MISRFFIERPVLANVIAVLMVIIGAVTAFRLPITQYPDVIPPTVQVTTRYPGASARTLIDTVALPIEQQVNGVQNMLYMQSYATSDGSYTLTVTFNIGTELNFAQVLVQNRVAAAMASLPQSVQVQGVTVQKQSTSILEMVTLTSPNGMYDSLYLSNYATLRIKDELARLPGVGNVTVFGAGQYAMRIWLDPARMQARSLNAQDVIQALQQQSAQVTAGQIGTPPAPNDQAFQYTLNVAGRLDDAEQFADVIVKAGSTAGDVTRVRDVGRVELGAQTYGQTFALDGHPAAGIAIYQSPDANGLETVKAVKARMDVLFRDFPEGVGFSVPFDITAFVKQSIDEVYKTLAEAGLLVLVVIVIFLQDWRATLIPATTVPVTIIGSFAAMAALGFTINLSTLFAIVLSIGIVVDDAIVVVEGASQNIEKGMNGHDAAIAAMRALFGPIIGITLVLMAVFLPASLLPGLTGRMYAQFALVIASTALLSAVNAATLKPTQCALWLRQQVPPERRNIFFRGFNTAYATAEGWYVRLIGIMTRRAGIVTVLAAVIVSTAGYGLSRIPTGFLPLEDQGYLIAAVQLPDGASLERTRKVLDQVSALSQDISGVAHVITISGVSAVDNSASLANAGIAYIMLKDWSERGKAEGLAVLYRELNARLSSIQAANVLLLPPPPIQGIGNAGGFTMEIELRDGSLDFTKLQASLDAVVGAARTQSAIQRVGAPFRSSVPQYDVKIDRTKTESLKLTTSDVFATLASYFGSSYVGQFNKFGRVYQIYEQADSRFRLRQEDVRGLTVRNQDGAMIPLGTLLKITPALGPSLISLYNLYPSASVVGAPAPGFSSGEALGLMDEVAERTLPRGMGAEWTAISYQEKIAGNQMYYIFALALLLVYLVLAGQYESWTAPFAVVLAVPMSLVGPVLVFTLLGLANNLYVQIGLMLLIALSAKNAILIVEVARDLHREGKSILDAATAAAQARFRPIMMTSFAFILGVAPLVFATGAGASARASIGVTVFSGMVASTTLAVLFVPSFFVLVQRSEDKRALRRSMSNQQV